MVEELKPCPFCGGEAKVITGSSTMVQCQNDQCIIGDPAPFNDFSHRYDAITAWNRRIPTPDGTGSGEAMREAVKEGLLSWAASTPDFAISRKMARDAAHHIMADPRMFQSTPKRDEEQAGEEAIERAALAIGEMIVAKSEEPQGRAETITAEDCRDLARAALAAAHKEQS